LTTDGAQFENASPDVSARAKQVEATSALGGRGTEGDPRRSMDDFWGVESALTGHDPYRAIRL
jgi:hypothetical protein